MTRRNEPFDRAVQHAAPARPSPQPRRRDNPVRGRVSEADAAEAAVDGPVVVPKFRPK